MKKKNKIWTGLLIGTGFLMIFMGSCKKDNNNNSNPTVPVLTTANVTNILAGAATSGGDITDDGGADITERGVCWGTSSLPTTSNTKTSDGTSTGTFSSSITGLTIGSTYYLRAFATNSAGTAYGNEVSFLAFGIGDTYKGGKVAYILQSNDPGYVSGETHGLIVAPNNQGANVPWNNVSTGSTYTYSGFGMGTSNTNILVNFSGSGYYAARLCYDLDINGYNDWFLPSKDELVAIYNNHDAIGSFGSSIYWSSSEMGNSGAWYVHFGSGSIDYSFRTSTFAVRAVRKF